METFNFNDGGRKDAGYKGETGDCVCRAIAIVTGKPYQEVYDAINELSKSKHLGSRKIKTAYGTSYVKVSTSRTGVVKKVYTEYLKSLGYEWIPIMGIGTGCKVHLKSDELPTGRIIVRLSKHLCAVIDGMINDIYDCSREGTRCVYGYYKKILKIITCKSKIYNYLCNMKNFIVNFRTNLNETMSMKINAVCKKQAIQKMAKSIN